MAGAAEELAFYIEFTCGGTTLGGAGLDCVEGAVAVLLESGHTGVFLHLLHLPSCVEVELDFALGRILMLIPPEGSHTNTDYLRDV